MIVMCNLTLTTIKTIETIQNQNSSLHKETNLKLDSFDSNDSNCTMFHLWYIKDSSLLEFVGDYWFVTVNNHFKS